MWRLWEISLRLRALSVYLSGFSPYFQIAEVQENFAKAQRFERLAVKQSLKGDGGNILSNLIHLPL
jgi:hypothetical protein